MADFPKRPPLESAEALLQEALQFGRAGRATEAISTLRHLLIGTPDSLAARCMLAMMLHESGGSEAALIELDHAGLLAPSDVVTQEVRGTVLISLGRMIEAEAAARAALAINVQRPRAWQTLGLALDGQERAEETISAMKSALALQPDSATARQVLARRLLQMKDADAALEFARHSSLLDDPVKTEATAAQFLKFGAPNQAIELLKALIRRQPQSYSSIIMLARSLHQMTRSSEALIWSDLAHKLRPAELEPVEMRAVSLIDRGDVEGGLSCLCDLVSRPEAGPESGNRYLILAHYHPGASNEVLFEAHLDWVRRYIRPFGAPFLANGRSEPDRVLRVGWISPRFGEGPVASFLTGLLTAFDRGQYRNVLIPLRYWNDDATQRLRGVADEWLPAHGFDNVDLLQRLRAANLDVAIDLTGHSFGNRLAVLAQRVAPLQLCWLDYFNTTAIQAIDGWISDPWLTPQDSTQRYTERLLTLPSGRFCYFPSPAAPEPYRVNAGPPVFVSFNRLAKLNDGVVEAWATILRRVPESRLELGAEVLVDTVVRSRTIERFAQHGIPSKRLRLSAARSYPELLSAYRQTDIALDPFPFSGCTTTCDALWMGVPVVTLPGSTFVSRQSASLLWRLEQASWVACDVTDYIDRAVDLADQVDELRRRRRDLREQTRSKLCDASTQASEFSELLRKLWNGYCDKARVDSNDRGR